MDDFGLLSTLRKVECANYLRKMLGCSLLIYWSRIFLFSFVMSASQKKAYVNEGLARWERQRAEWRGLAVAPKEISDGNCDAKNGRVSSTRKVCAECGASPPKLHLCGACRLVYYCNRDCQKRHRRCHKADCKRALAERKHLATDQTKERQRDSAAIKAAVPPTGDNRPLLDLPDALLNHALAFLSHRDAARLVPVCRSFAERVPVLSLWGKTCKFPFPKGVAEGEC